MGAKKSKCSLEKAVKERGDYEQMSRKEKVLAPGTLSWGTRIAYGCGDAACNVVFGMVNTLLTLFYTDYVGVSVATIGLVMLLSRIFDGSSDIIMGFIVDKTHSKWGKGRPWLLWMAVPYALSAISLFTVPQTSESLQFWYIFVSYNLCTTVIYTAINVPYGTLAVRMTRSSDERSMLSVMRLVIARMGQIVTVVSTMPLVKLLGDTQASWIKVITLWSIIACGLLLFCFFRCKETVCVEEKVTEKKKVPLGKSLLALVKNQYFWAVLFLFALENIHSQVVGIVLPYYCKYLFHNDSWMYSALYFAEIGVIVAVSLICPTLLKRVSKRNLALAGALFACVSHLLFLLNPYSFAWIAFTTVLRAIGEAPAYALLFSMIADAVEFGQWKTHMRQESLVLGCSSMGYKVGTGVASAIVSGLLMLSGYISSTAGGVAQPDSALSMIFWIYVVAPLLVWGLISLLLALYKLDNKMPKILADLQEREKNGAL